MGDILERKANGPRRSDDFAIPLFGMLSLVFSVLTFALIPVGLDVGALVAALAVVCAHIARYQIAHDAYKGKWVTLPGLAVGYGMLALFVLTLPEWGQREKARRINCAANLKQIGMACRMYADDYAGEFPPTLQTRN